MNIWLRVGRAESCIDAWHAGAKGSSRCLNRLRLRKRRHPNAVTDIEDLFAGTVAADWNAIPEEAVDHIEMLRDGACPMSRSDAIAAVAGCFGEGPNGAYAYGVRRRARSFGYLSREMLHTTRPPSASPAPTYPVETCPKPAAIVRPPSHGPSAFAMLNAE
jgi:hypothetical protein